MSHGFIRVPPDSTGKRVRHNARLDVKIINVTFDFKSVDRGVTIIGNTSGKSGKFVGHKVELGEEFIYIAEATGDFTPGETLSITGTPIGEVSSITDLYTPTASISDPDVPTNRLKIDNQGSASITFSEGNPSMDAFGNLQVSHHNRLDDHTFVYGDRPDKYYTLAATGGASNVNLTDSALVLSVTNAANSSISRTTNQYYPYAPGHGTEVLMSVMIGDEGKAGVVRRWGLFDTLNGVFFQMSGTVFQVVVRNNSTGVVVDEVYNQNEFNGDPLDDVSQSEYLLNVSRYNLYWIDFQWLGVGRIRFGTFAPNGTKTVVHTVNNANSKTVPYMNNGTLPFKIEQFNKTNTASSSEMRLVCASILRQTSTTSFAGKIFDLFTDNVGVSGSTSYKPLISFRPATTYAGKANRITIIPQDFEFFVEGDSVRIDFVVNGTLTNSTFTLNANPLSSTQVDSAATVITGGIRANSLILGPGATKISFEDNFDYAVSLGADGTSQPTFTVGAKTNKSNGVATVTMVARWKELR